MTMVIQLFVVPGGWPEHIVAVVAYVDRGARARGNFESTI